MFGKTFKSGKINFEFDEEERFVSAVIEVGKEPYTVLIAANAADTVTLFYALRHIFDDGKKYTNTVHLLGRAERIGSSWSYLMPLVSEPETFWICTGPLSVYVSTEEMREVYHDFLAAGADKLIQEKLRLEPV